MLYEYVECQRALMRPWTAWMAGAMHVWGDTDSPLAQLPGATYLAAGCDLLSRLGCPCEKPGFGIQATRPDGRLVPVTEEVILEHPFCRLLRFVPETVAPRRGAEMTVEPAVLVCAPLAGHHAVLLRELVQTMLAEHAVYVTDWIDASRVPVASGPFHLDDYVALVQRMIRHLGAERLHVLAVCQATVPALAAISLLASAGEPTPRSLVLMGGPIDARRNPTALDIAATQRPLDWFRRHLIDSVPDSYPGAGRKVYPGFLQYVSLLAAHPGRVVGAQLDEYLALVRGGAALSAAHRNASDGYNAMLDMAAEFYLDTVRIVFQEFGLARGTWCVGGEPVRPAAIRSTALLTVEGEQDDVAGLGQTQAAHDLCSGIPKQHRRHLVARRCDHYGLFCGPHWRTEIYPVVRDFIRHGA